MQAGDRQRDRQLRTVGAPEHEPYPLPGLDDAGDTPVSGGVGAHAGGPGGRRQGGTIRVVNADDDGAVGPLDECPEGVPEQPIVAVMVEVVGLDVGDHPRPPR